MAPAHAQIEKVKVQIESNFRSLSAGVPITSGNKNSTTGVNSTTGRRAAVRTSCHRVRQSQSATQRRDCNTCICLSTNSHGPDLLQTDSVMSAQPLANSWFVAPEFPLKAIDSCGNELPAAYIPECDRTLGSDTRACECAGLKKVDYVAVKGTRMCDLSRH